MITKAMRCPFTLKVYDDADLSVEHIFPEAIGGTNALTLPNVHKDTNSRLGTEIDSLMTKHFLIENQRNILGIGGKTGKVPSPLGKQGVLSSDPATKVRYEHDSNGKPVRLFVVPNVLVTPVDGGYRVEAQCDASDADKLVEMVNKSLVRKNLTPLDADVLRAKMVKTKETNPQVKIEIPLALYDYYLPLLKIAYELTYMWLGDSFLDDPVAAMIRTAIWDKSWDDNWTKRNPLHGQAGLAREHELLKFWANDSVSHLGMLMRTDNTISCTVRVFNTFGATVEVSRNARAYNLGEHGKFLALNPVTADLRTSTVVQELERLST